MWRPTQGPSHCHGARRSCQAKTVKRCRIRESGLSSFSALLSASGNAGHETDPDPTREWQCGSRASRELSQQARAAAGVSDPHLRRLLRPAPRAQTRPSCGVRSERDGSSNPLAGRDVRSNPGHSSLPANQVQRHAIRLHRHHVPAVGPFTAVKLGSDQLSPVRPGDVEAENLTDPVPSQHQLPPTPGPWVRN